MKTRYWIAAIAAVLLICTLGSLVLFAPGGGAGYARITSGGTLVRTVDLRVDQEFTVTLEEGRFNTITVKDGKIAVTQASCPDQHCARRGWCSGGTQIVCLPNTLVITFVDAAEVDAAVG